MELRVEALLDIASQYATGVSVDHLTALLPATAPGTPAELVDWLEDRPHLASVVDGRAFSPAVPPTDPAEREARAIRYRAEAERLVHQDLAAVLPFVRAVGVSGSTAYGEPNPGDDLDFFVVTATGALWVFAAYAFLQRRLRNRPTFPDGDRPYPCYNYLLDERTARLDFARPQGFLFAREALTSRVVHGSEFFGSLLGDAPWMAHEIPRLYRDRAERGDPLPPRAAPWAIRLVNLVLFPFLSAFLQLEAIRRNGKLRDSGALDAMYRTETRWGRFTVSSRRFESLRRRFSTL